MLRALLNARSTSTRSTLTFSALLAIGLVSSGCDDSRFPVCKNSSECNPKSEDSAAPASSARPKVCYDLRCVECHYDSDCRDGEICNTQMSECRQLDPTTPAASGPAPGEPGSGVTPPNSGPREPEKWEACVKKCANKDCIAKCDAQYE